MINNKYSKITLNGDRHLEARYKLKENRLKAFLLKFYDEDYVNNVVIFNKTLNKKEILEKIKISVIKRVRGLSITKSSKNKDSQKINSFIDTVFNVLDNVKIDEQFLISIYCIMEDFVQLVNKLTILKSYESEKGMNEIKIFLDGKINKIKQNEAFTVHENQKMEDLFFLTDRNYFAIDKIKDNKQKEEIEESIQKFYKGYKLDKISIIENLKKQIENLHIQGNKTITFEDIKNHTINSIIFNYKDYYNIKIVIENKKELNSKDNHFLYLIRYLKLNRRNVEYLFINERISKKDFELLECCILFDSFTILDYSTKSFLGRKLMTFFDDTQKQSKEFGKLKEDLEVTKESIKIKE